MNLVHVGWFADSVGHLSTRAHIPSDRHQRCPPGLEREQHQLKLPRQVSLSGLATDPRYLLDKFSHEPHVQSPRVHTHA